MISLAPPHGADARTWSRWAVSRPDPSPGPGAARETSGDAGRIGRFVLEVRRADAEEAPVGERRAARQGTRTRRSRARRRRSPASPPRPGGARARGSPACRAPGPDGSAPCTAAPFARPKSVSAAEPSSRSMTFDGLTSRWTMPPRWSASRPAATVGDDAQRLARGRAARREPRRPASRPDVLEHEVRTRPHPRPASGSGRGADPRSRAPRAPRGRGGPGTSRRPASAGSNVLIATTSTVRRAPAVDDTDRTPAELLLERVVAESQCLRHGSYSPRRRREGARLPVGSDPLPGSEIAGFRSGGAARARAAWERSTVPRTSASGARWHSSSSCRSSRESERFRERFLRESQIAASLDHPHIVPIYAAGDADGQLYLAMRYVEGYDLRQLIAREAPLDPDRALRLIEQVGDALDAAHERGLVHRDVKPGNVLIAGALRPGALLPDGLRPDEADVLDLGSDRDRRAGRHDRVRLARADPRRDGRRARGRVLPRLRAVRVPGRRAAVRARVRGGDAVGTRQRAAARSRRDSPELGSEIDAVMARALAKAPAERYGSCGELVASARAALGLPE